MNFKINIKLALAILAMVFAVKSSQGQQDPMYTQYFFNTQTINPAYTGTWRSLGFMVLARQQWAGWENAPKTYTFSIQAPMKNDRVGLGLSAISDNIFMEKRFGVWADYSYKLNFSLETNLRLGLKAGFTNYTNNLTLYEKND